MVKIRLPYLLKIYKRLLNDKFPCDGTFVVFDIDVTNTCPEIFVLKPVTHGI